MVFRRSPPGAVFCRRATRSPTVASPDTTALLLLQEGYLTLVSVQLTGSWWLSKPSTPTASRISAPSGMYVSLLSKISLVDVVFCLGPHRDYALMLSSGNDYNTQTWLVSLALAPIILHSLLFTLGCPTGTWSTMYASTPTSINSVWYVIVPDVIDNSLNNPDPLSISVIGRRSRVDLPSSE